MKYREEIDGLRALAILPVILYHSGIIIFSGGYIGVDVFFVISGFLISTQIIQEKNNNVFSLINFYERRIRRIVPALFFVLIISIPLFWLVMLPHQYKDFSESIFATIFFSSNILFWLESGYFESSSELKPLLHTWSLAVEEQFYIFIPLLFLIFWKSSKKILILIFSLIFLASFMLMEVMRLNDSDFVFYFLFTRMWELLVGLLAALVVNKIQVKEVYKNQLSFLGFVLIIVPVFTFDSLTPFPSFYTLMPVTGTALIILFCNKQTLIYRFLNIKILKYIGLISYSAYLWHQPIFVFSRLDNPMIKSDVLLILLGIISLLLASFTYVFIEKPFRNKKLIRRRSIFILFFIFSIGLAYFGYKGHITNGFFNYKINSLPDEYQNKIIDRNHLLEMRSPVWNKILENSDEIFENKNKKNVLILGDSKGQDLFVSLKLNEELYPNIEFRYSYLDDKCMLNLSKESEVKISTECLIESDFNKINLLLHDSQIIIMTATWMQHTYTNVLDFIKNPRLERKEILILSTGNFYDLPSMSLQIIKSKFSRYETDKYFYENRRLDWQKISKKIENELYFFKNATYKNRFDIFCDDKNHTCKLYSNIDEPFIWDSGHLTIEGAKFQGKKIKELEWLD